MDQILPVVIDALVSVILLLLVPLALKGLQWVLVRVKLDKSIAAQAIVRSAVAYAEEYAAKQMRATGAKIAGKVKLDMAVTRILAKLPGVTEEEARELVQSELPKIGLGATGALQSLAAAIQSPK